MIVPLQGDDLGIYKDENYYVLEWRDWEGHRVVFSATRYGDAILCHFAPAKDSLRVAKIACLDFIDWVFSACEWCKMLLSAVDKPSIMRFVGDLGFVDIARDENGKHVFMRERSWER